MERQAQANHTTERSSSERLSGNVLYDPAYVKHSPPSHQRQTPSDL